MKYKIFKILIGHKDNAEIKRNIAQNSFVMCALKDSLIYFQLNIHPIQANGD